MTNMARMEMLATFCIRFLVALVEKRVKTVQVTGYVCSRSHPTWEKVVGFLRTFIVVSFWC